MKLSDEEILATLVSIDSEQENVTLILPIKDLMSVNLPQLIRQLKEERDTYKAEVQALNKGVRSWEQVAMRKQAECTKYREALEGAHEGLMYAMNLINNYDVHKNGSKVTASTNFHVIKKRYAETKIALGKDNASE